VGIYNYTCQTQLGKLISRQKQVIGIVTKFMFNTHTRHIFQDLKYWPWIRLDYTKLLFLWTDLESVSFLCPFRITDHLIIEFMTITLANRTTTIYYISKQIIINLGFVFKVHCVRMLYRSNCKWIVLICRLKVISIFVASNVRLSKNI